eukprot:g193.t1
MCLPYLFLFGAAVSSSIFGAASAAATDPARVRAEKLVAQMTQDEKFGFIQQNKDSTNVSSGYTGALPAVPRLGIPEMRMNDGPQGFRGPAGTSTQWPSGLTVAHSWDRALFRQWGEALGAEFAGKGANVMYGPGLNVQRLSNGGRSFEYGSGEDPFLGYELIQGEVRGIQSQGVVANAKHFIDNQQEGYLKGAGDRHYTNEIVDEKTQMELYWPPFEGAIKAGVLSIMCANNMVNGVYVCENNRTGNWLLREHGGFQGWMCSDYDGTRSTIDAANHGLDIAMPGPPHRPDYFGAPLRKAVENGDVSQATIDEKVTRVVYALAKVGALDTPKAGNASTDVTSGAHRALARTLAASAATLLRNERGALPLDLAALKRGKPGSVALIGSAAAAPGAIFGGGGSGAVQPKEAVSVHDALLSRLGQQPPAPTFTCDTVDKDTDYFAGKGGSTRLSAKTVDACCAGCHGNDPAKWASFTFDAASGNCWCHSCSASTATKRNHTGYVSGGCAPAPAPEPVPGPLVYNDGTDAASAAALAKTAAVAIVVLAQTSHEGADRTTLALDQDALVASVTAAQPNTVVLAVSPGPFLTAWRGGTAAIVELGMAGEQEGEAAADVLFGDVNPGGKLPHTLPNAWNETAMAPRQYPGVPPSPDAAKGEAACSTTPTAPTADGHNPAGGTGFAPCSPYEAHYDEGLEVGYRWYDAHGVAPAYAFGHGLSYTTFSYSNLTVSASAVSVDVANTGKVGGQEVAQLYLAFPASRFKQLKGFEKVQLGAGETQTVTFALNDRSVSEWDVGTHAWLKTKGEFSVMVGSSSRDIRQQGKMIVQ